ncbi:MAG: metalloregulator ArsR/SmtB family transcription factor [Chitinivibrionales bacterium]|nr:metalloregulator ArsR/SmtB family transcription factor [Chitinivibrionales bacterium]
MNQVDYDRISETLKALAHPVRFRITAGILKNECCVGEIQNSVRLPQSTVSQHLGKLKSAGIIKERKDGTRRCYRVIDKQAKHIIRAIEG